MMARHPRAVVVSFLIGLVGLGSAHVAAQEAASPDPMLPNFTSLNPMKTVERVALKGFIERPLFDPSRRLPPVAPPMAVVEAPSPVTLPEPPPTLRLLGVIRGTRDMAFVQRDGTDKTIILRTGDKIGEWKVTVLSSVGIRLHDRTRAFDYAMFAKSAGVGPVAATPDKSSRDKTEMSDALAARNARLQKRTY